MYIKEPHCFQVYRDKNTTAPIYLYFSFSYMKDSLASSQEHWRGFVLSIPDPLMWICSCRWNSATWKDLIHSTGWSLLGWEIIPSCPFSVNFQNLHQLSCLIFQSIANTHTVVVCDSEAILMSRWLIWLWLESSVSRSPISNLSGMETETQISLFTVSEN